MTTLSTHVLDSVRGRPAAGLAVRLTSAAGLDSLAHTDDDGRFRWELDLAGTVVLEFGTGSWFAEAGRETIYPRIRIEAAISGGHTHLALLLGPYSYTTYKGS